MGSSPQSIRSESENSSTRTISGSALRQPSISSRSSDGEATRIGGLSAYWSNAHATRDVYYGRQEDWSARLLMVYFLSPVSRRFYFRGALNGAT